MAYTNLPPNLYDYFSTINQRIRKLESAPDQAMTTATSAQGTASDAYAQAINASIQATNAAYTAGVAYSSANGKNTTNYASYAPSPSSNNTNGTVPITGDLWFVVNPSTGYASDVYTYKSGSWGHSPLDGSSNVILNIDAGKLVAGTIIANVAISNGGGTFYVDRYGNLSATSASIQGTVTATSGSIAGFTIGSSQLSNSQMTIYSNGNITSLGTINASVVSAGTSLTSAGTLVVSGNSTLGNPGSTTTTANLTIDSTANIVGGYGVTSDWSPNTDNHYNLGISGSLRWSHVYANNTTITTSDQRLKTNITNSALGLDFINSLRPVSYQWIEGGKNLVVDAEGNPVVESVDEHGKPVYKTESIPGKRTHYGLIAQEVKSALDAANVGDFAGWVQDDMTNPDSFQSVSYEQFISPLIKSVQELSDRLNKLEGK